MSKRIIANFLFLIIVLVSVGVALWSNRESTVSVFASTETVTIYPHQHVVSAWDISKSTLYPDELNPEKFTLLDSDGVSLLPGEGAKILLEKHAGDALQITINSKIGLPSKIVYSDGSSILLKGSTALELECCWPRTFPVMGAVELGDDVADGVNHLLLDAKVQLIEKQLVGDERYVASETELDSGDRIILTSVDDNKKPLMNGFIRIGNGIEGGGVLNVVLHANDVIVKIGRMGSVGYTIRESIWTRLIKDPIAILVTTFVGVLFFSLQFEAAINDLISRVSKKAKENE